LTDVWGDCACTQQTQQKGSGCKFYEAKGQRYTLFWMGGEERSDGVEIFLTEKWWTVLLVSKGTLKGY